MKNIIGKIKNSTWYRHGIYRTNVLTSHFVLSYLGPEWFKKEDLDRGLSNIISLGEDYYILENEKQILIDEFTRKFNIKYFKKYIADYNKDNNNTLTASKRAGERNHKNADIKALKSAFEDFFIQSRELMHWLWSMEFLNPAIDNFISKQIQINYKSWTEKQVYDFLQTISYVPKQLHFQKETDEALLLNKITESEIKKLYKRYSWLNMYGWGGRPYSFEDYSNRVKAIFNNRSEINNKTKDTKTKIKHAMHQIEKIKSNNLKELLLIAQELIYLKTYRIDVFTQSWFYMLPVVDEICRRLGITYRDLLRLTSYEIIEGIEKGKIDIDLSRRDKFAVVKVEDRVSIYFGNQTNKIKNALIKEDYTKLKKIKGDIAYKGKVKGIAKVLKTDEELGKLNKGDILVSNLTNPNYNQAFGIISGIVTDEGGLLCHSAIMAREFRLPCVINTKIATLVIKDGDLIEVDAEKGIVKIIKSYG